MMVGGDRGTNGSDRNVCSEKKSYIVTSKNCKGDGKGRLEILKLTSKLHASVNFAAFLQFVIPVSV